MVFLPSQLPFSVSLQAFFSANAAAHASRKSSPRVTNEAVQKAVSISLGLNFRLPYILDLDHLGLT